MLRRKFESTIHDCGKRKTLFLYLTNESVDEKKKSSKRPLTYRWNQCKENHCKTHYRKNIKKFG